jgi:hypothetical protein
MRASMPARIGTLVGASVLAAASTVAMTGVASAAAKPPAATFLHLNNKVVAHAKHHTDAIAGVLTSRRKGVSGETVTLMSRTGKHRKWATVTTATSGTGGSVSFTIAAPSTTTQYEALFAGDATNHLRKSRSNIITVTVTKHHK